MDFPCKLKSVSDLNNWAVILLQQANYSGAIECLHQALAQAQKNYNAFGSSLRSQEEQPSAMAVSLKPSQSKEKEDPSMDANGDANGFAFFDHAFVTLPSFSLQGTEQATSNLTMSLLLYNSGLAVHKRATVQKISARSMEIALRFYRRALSCVNHHDNKISSAEVLLLRLGLLNNIGHAASSMHQREEAQHCDREIRQLMSVRSFLLLPTWKDEYRFFALNVIIHATGHGFALAPAA